MELLREKIDLTEFSKQPDAGLVLGWVLAANDIALTLYMQEQIKMLDDQRHIREFSLGGLNYVQRLLAAQAASALGMAPVSASSPLFNQLLSAWHEANPAFQVLLDLSAGKAGKHADWYDLIGFIV